MWSRRVALSFPGASTGSGTDLCSRVSHAPQLDEPHVYDHEEKEEVMFDETDENEKDEIALDFPEDEFVIQEIDTNAAFIDTSRPIKEAIPIKTKR